jgi:hypothetical protein
MAASQNQHIVNLLLVLMVLAIWFLRPTRVEGTHMINATVEEPERVARGLVRLAQSHRRLCVCVTTATGWTLRPSPSLQHAFACLTG